MYKNKYRKYFSCIMRQTYKHRQVIALKTYIIHHVEGNYQRAMEYIMKISCGMQAEFLKFEQFKKCSEKSVNYNFWFEVLKNSKNLEIFYLLLTFNA